MTSKRLRASKTRALSGFLTGASINALAVAGVIAPTWAHAQTEQAVSVEEVVVTGSRIVRDGYSAPTPVTVVGADQLQATSPVTIAQALNELPAFAGGVKPQSQAATTSGGGQNYLSLRNLGAARTLVLLDGRRFVPSSGSGTTDINLMPQALIQRVDIVTGGASAAYGSDAVAGVVNFVLDKKFNGLKINLQGGVSDRGDAKSYSASVAFGRALGARGHIIGSLEYARDQGIRPYGYDPVTNRAWNAVPYQVIPNPNGSPQFIRIPDARISVASWGGLVTSGPLKGIDFGLNGQPGSFVYGSYANTLSQRMSGGTGPNILPRVGLQAPLQRSAAFVHADYDLTENTTAYVEGSFAQGHSQYGSNYLYLLGNGLTIQRDNPYLPESVRTRMTALNLTTLPVGVYMRGLGIITPDNATITERAVAGLDGAFNDKWKWSAYVEYGSNRAKDQSLNNVVLSKFYQAVDAVINPATGGIVCRSTLTNPTNGCVPLNPLGERNITKEAAAYVHGDMYNKLTTTQLVAEASVRGEVFNLPAGSVSVAGGAGYRREEAKGLGDPVSSAPNPITGLPGGYFLTNRRALSGEFDTTELFGETVIPVLRDLPWAQSLDVNAAVRYTNYSTSGAVTTYKLGATYDATAEFRFRATQSRDIRAANIGELFSAPAQGRNSVIDPVLGGISYNIQPTSSGNPDLDPEVADTTAVGVVYRPNWLPGFSVSVDGYDINIKGAIGGLSSQETVDQCQTGSAAACALIIRDVTTKRILDVRQVQLNLLGRRVSGVDIEASYVRSIGEGRISLRGLMNYVDKFATTSPTGLTIDRAGDVGTPTGNTPRWRGYYTAAYSRGPLSVSVQEKYVGKGKYNVLWTSAQLADEFNNIPGVWTTSATAKYKVSSAPGEPEFFVTVNNLFDKDPPINPNNSISSTNTNLDLYDGVGRAYVMGLRLRY